MRKKEPDTDKIIDHVFMEILHSVFLSIHYFTSSSLQEG